MIKKGQKYLFNNYGPRDMMLVKGEGCYVWDSDGKKYLDCLAGIAVCSLGHCHPKLVKVVQEQAANLFHVSNLYLIETQVKLAELLVENSCFDKAFFGNSGTEVAETAVKLVRRFAYSKGEKNRTELISMEKSFHGRTYGALSITGQPVYHEGFAPMLPGVKYAKFNDLSSLEKLVDDKTAGVFIEAVQGEGGIRPADPEFLQGARKICDERGAVLVFDEIQCGLGRTGTLFAYEDSGIEPDVALLAKALGNGLPVAALLAKEEVAAALIPGSHGNTFGGNPICCASALAAVQTIIEEKIPQKAKEMGNYLLGKLAELKTKVNCIIEIRGKGLMVGVEFNQPVKEIIKKMRENGVIVGMAGANVLRMVPPLIITKDQIDTAVQNLEEIIKTL